MKYSSLLLITLLIISSCQEKKLNGKWIEIDENSYSWILTFEGDKLTVEYLNACDTFKFKVSNRYFTRYSSIDTFSVPIFWRGDSIFSWDSIFFFKRFIPSQSMDSFPIFSKVKITLPIIKGVMLKPKPYFEKLYTYYIEVNNDSVKIKYGKTKIKNELDLLKFIEARSPVYEIYNSINIIYADKDCKYKYISKIKNLLRYCRSLKVTYAAKSVKSKSIYSLTGISMRLPQLSYFDEKNINSLLEIQSIQERKNIEIVQRTESMHPPSPPPPSIFDIKKERKTLLEVYNDSLLLNKQVVNMKIYLSKLAESIKNDQKHILFYYINGETTYDNYIQLLDKTFNIFYERRKEVALNIYNKNFEFLNDSIQSEIKQTVPISIVEIGEKDLISTN